jgi:hypothetical protein
MIKKELVMVRLEKNDPLMLARQLQYPCRRRSYSADFKRN